MFLNANELIELTGYKQPRFQKNWLIKNGIACMVGGDGKCKVSKQAALQALGLKSSQASMKKDKPRFDLM